MVAERHSYALRGGTAGYDRLLVLARELRADTLRFLDRADISAGMRCADLGCGGGAVSFDLAMRVGPTGSVVGIDMDPVKLDLARAAAREHGVRNVELRQLAVEKWNEPDTYDVLYSRNLLQHLREPVDLLRRMWEALRPGGRLMVEDADHDGWACHPPNRAFEFYVRSLSQVLDRRGGDHAIGRKLYEYFAKAGIPAPQVSIAQQARVVGEGKTLAPLTLESISDALRAEGLASAEELERVLSELVEYTNDPHTLICGPRIFQLLSRK